MPEPTVIVRMRENGRKLKLWRSFLAAFGSSSIPVTLRKLVMERIENSDPDFLFFYPAAARRQLYADRGAGLCREQYFAVGAADPGAVWRLRHGVDRHGVLAISDRHRVRAAAHPQDRAQKPQNAASGAA